MTREEAIVILSNSLYFSKEYGEYVLEEWDEEAIRTLIKPQWIPTKEKSPDKDGEYLVTVQGFIIEHKYIDTCQFALNLNDVDEYDFPAYLGYSRPGWYKYGSDSGYYECDDIIAWTELPEVYKEEE